jgi:DNA-binding CsgD family transcriptional regulator
MPIVGRETELDLLTSFARGEGEAVLAFVEGEAGVGKTALWSAVIERADGVRVLEARPTAAETGAAYAALDDLVAPVRAALARGADPRRRALAVALMLEQADAPPEPRAVAVGLLSLLEELAAAGPALIAVDDWQWLDASSASVLGFALRRLPAGGARVLATLRTGEADAAAAAIVRSLPEGRALELPLDPLGPSELLHMVHLRTGRWLSAPALERLHAASGGNALAALELARAGDGAARHASDVRRLMAARVTRLAPPARDVVRGAAVLSAATVPTLALAVPDAAGGLEEALAAEVLVCRGEELRFSHPLYAAVVEELTPPDDWRALHRRAAEAVTDPEQRARHLATAAIRPDADVAATLERAASGATARGAPAAAAELLQRAAELTPRADSDRRVRRLLDAAESHIHAGDGEAAHGLLAGLVEELEPGPVRARALLRLAWVTTTGNDRALARQALEEAGDDDALLGWIHLTLANVLFNREGADVADAHTRLAAEYADRCGDAMLRVRAGLGLALHRFLRGEGVQREALLEIDRLEREASGPAWETTALIALGLQLAQTGELDEGRRILLAELDRASANAEHAGFIRTLLTDLELRAGRWQLADEHAQRALELDVGSEMSNAESAVRCARAKVDAHLGRVDVAHANAERGVALADAAEDFVYVIWARHALGFLALSLGDTEEAVRRLSPLPSMAARLGIREPMVFGVEPDLAEALVLTGAPDAARDVLERLAAVGRELDRPWAVACALRCRGLIAAAEGRHEDAVADHLDAIELFERIGQPFERARTLLALGTAQRRAKHRGAARASLQAAHAVFAELGAELWAHRASEEIARLGGRRAGDRDALTPTEQRVAELAAEGRSNREIAAELFVSERTVEANLTRAYRKLGVRSRTQLARRLPSA